MNFDLGDLRAFLAVADLGSLRAASQALHLSQSALSRRIDKLEDALGVALFTRTTRKVELTTVGRAFVPKARNVLNELASALLGIQDVAERLSGEVTLACVPSAVGYFLPSVFAEYHRRYPRIRIRVLDEASSDVLLAVTRGEADFGVTYIGTQEADIEFQPLIEEPFVLACPKRHPLAKRKAVRWSELGAEKYIALAQGSGNRFLIDQALAHVEQRPRWFCEVNHVPALVSLVLAGLGIGVVPRMALPPDGQAGLAAIALTEPRVSRTLGLISRRGKALPAAAQLLFDMLLESKGRA
ncbi:LysR family transcriptional regulator [Comamonas endophytica]|uniref:LysR family transcriptional regulator n=1 Tax=Comamonas endophytica TaxID=2949090 RepID=A0ABY6GF62_9BURK|nr:MULTISPECIES: LysR family transcriptional regulator [unclassified Acidovorax]MCD2514291.1 LysR family transcriptional regulator [Acidovorax sp. D4N7]UYG53541.1 LysR family transcriptional regulator [Acidovorax sp. 5MLIR]